MASRHMKRFATSPIIGEMQIKTQWDTTSYLSKWLLWKRQETTNVEEDVVKKGPLHTGGGNLNWYGHYGEQNGGSSEN